MRHTRSLGWPIALSVAVLVTACGANDSGSSISPPSAGVGGSSQGGSGGSGGSEPSGAGGDAGQPTCAGLSESVPRAFYLSADDSNSMASPVIARRMIREDLGLIRANVIRTYEFLNYYNVLADPPQPNDLRVTAQAVGALDGNPLELQLLVQSAGWSSTRRPMTVTLVLDTSGSMSGRPLTQAKAVIRALAARLIPGDIVSAVTWNVAQTELMSGHLVEGPSDSAVLQVADSLVAGGSTDLHNGLQAGYALAKAHYGSDRINRVVLVSDGQANVGVVDENLIGEQADDENKEGIYLVGVGTGDGFNDTLMNTVTDAGNGAYVFIDSEAEAQKMFNERFDEVMLVAARNVRVKVTVPWYMQMARFHGEQYATVPGKVKPQHLAPGDSMVFQQLLAPCGNQQMAAGDRIEWEVGWSEPTTFADRSVSGGATLDELVSGAGKQARRGRAIIEYAEFLKAAYELSVADRRVRLDTVRTAVESARADGTDAELEEVGELLERYGKMVAP